MTAIFPVSPSSSAAAAAAAGRLVARTTHTRVCLCLSSSHASDVHLISFILHLAASAALLHNGLRVQASPTDRLHERAALADFPRFSMDKQFFDASTYNLS